MSLTTTWRKLSGKKIDAKNAINPKIPDLYNNLSISLCQTKKFDEALLSWDKAIKIKPNFISGALIPIQHGNEIFFK